MAQTNVSRKELSKNPDPQFKSEPFFEKNGYYEGEEEYYSSSSKEDSKERPKEEPNNSNESIVRSINKPLSFLIFIGFTVFVVILTLHFSDRNSKFNETKINQSIEKLSSEIKAERNFFLKKVDKITQKLQNLKSKFEGSDRNSTGNLVLQTEIDLLKKQFLKNKNDFQAMFNKYQKQLLKANKNNEKINEVRLSLKQYQEQFKKSKSMVSHNFKKGDINKIFSDLREMKNEIRNTIYNVEHLSKSFDGGSENRFITYEEFKTEIGTIKEKLEFESMHEMFAKIRDGNKVDWANLLIGGNVVTVQNRFKFFHGIFSESNKENVITPIISPGDCIALHPSQGYIVISLRKVIIPEGFSYESVSPGSAPSFGSVPKKIEVYAVDSSEKIPLFITAFHNDGKKARVEFKFKPTARPTNRLLFRFLENHGNPSFTCVYKIRIYGREPKNK